jgi:predicted phosphodiesterase
MKTIVLGDTHGRTDWKTIVQSEADRIIFIGDYVDTHENITPLQQVENLREIIAFKQKNDERVVLLIGNHDYHYWPGVQERYSGYQHQMRATFEYEFREHRGLFQVVHEQDGTLFSHAGITEQWLKNSGIDLNRHLVEEVNDLFEFRPNAFGFNGYDPYGDNITQGPLWVRPRSLMKNFVDNYKQVVGHTTMKYIEPKHFNDERDLFWFIDTLGTSGEYLVIEDGEFKIEKVAAH